MQCPQCQVEIRDTPTFCEDCGSKLARSCPGCGQEVSRRATFCAECGTRLLASALSPMPNQVDYPQAQASDLGASLGPSSPQRRVPEAERRQLTVLFCDLVDSTALANQLDPEEWRDVVRAYQETGAEVIQRFDGHIAQYLGDGLLVYFGYPQAHEDDAQRAVRSGLGMIEAIGKLNTQLQQDTGLTLAIRVGIHTGLVVVGAMGGSGRQKPLALGDTPNIAARLQGFAEPDAVMISAATQRLVQGYFACQDRGLHSLKGVTAPLAVYRVLVDHGVQSRLEASSPRGLTPFVGREPDLLYQQGLPPQAIYCFKHTLVQKAAYQSLLKSTRQQAHRRTAQALETQFPQTVKARPELLAHHFTEAGLPRQAVIYWQQAGQRALQASAYAEAIVHLTTGLELLETLPDVAERTQQELTLGYILHLMGELVLAQTHLEQGLAIYDPQQHHTYGFVFDPGVDSLCLLAQVRQMLGYPNQALHKSQEALALARQLAHPFSLAAALRETASVHRRRGEQQHAQALQEEGLGICREQGFARELALGTIMYGPDLLRQGQGEAGIAQMRQGLVDLRVTGTEAELPWLLSMLATACGNVGRAAEGLSLVDEALAMVHRTGKRLDEAGLYRVKGELLLQSRGQPLASTGRSLESEVEECFRQALEVARRQQAKSSELRAATSLSRLWQQQGKRAEARQLLAEIYGWFTEGFDTTDLREARTLLETLA